jgi:hypothetical protein
MHNLNPTTPFVVARPSGRPLSPLTRQSVRLLTLLAPGGMGKTRLALEAAEQQLYHFPDGVYFVPLQALSDPEHIVTASPSTPTNQANARPRVVLTSEQLNMSCCWTLEHCWMAHRSSPTFCRLRRA